MKKPLLMLALFAGLSGAKAADVTFTGTGNQGIWSDPGSWSPAVPADGDNATLVIPGVMDLLIDQTVTLPTLTVQIAGSSNTLNIYNQGANHLRVGDVTSLSSNPVIFNDDLYAVQTGTGTWKGTIDVNGNFFVDQGKVTLANDTGVFTAAAFGSDLNFTISADGSNWGTIFVPDGLVLSLGSGVSIILTSNQGYAFQAGDSFTLIDVATSGTLNLAGTPDFSQLPGPGAGLAWQPVYAANSDLILNVVAVPEPALMGLIALSGGVVAFVRSRRRERKEPGR